MSINMDSIFKMIVLGRFVVPRHPHVTWCQFWPAKTLTEVQLFGWCKYIYHISLITSIQTKIQEQPVTQILHHSNWKDSGGISVLVGKTETHQDYLRPTWDLIHIILAIKLDLSSSLFFPVLRAEPEQFLLYKHHQATPLVFHRCNFGFVLSCTTNAEFCQLWRRYVLMGSLWFTLVHLS